MNRPPLTEFLNLKTADPKPHISVELLAEMTRALSSQDSLALVLEEILRQAQRLVFCQATHIMLLEENNLRIVAWHGYQAFDSERMMSRLVQPLANFPLDSRVVESRQALIISDTTLESHWTVQAETSWVRSNIMVPICLGDRTLGVLRMDADTPRAFSSKDVLNLQPLVNIAAIALENVRLMNQARQEINERKRAEEALQRSVAELSEEIARRKQVDEVRRQLSAAIEQTAESVVITDPQGNILYVNPAFQRITGYSQSEAIGQTPGIVKHGQQDPAFYTDLWATIKAGKVWKGRFINKKKDGTTYTLDSTISPVRDKNGTIVNYVQVGRDITRELQLEEQYRQAQKMEAIGRLAGGIAHDFNNLLTVITGFSEMMQSQLSPDHPLQEYIESVLYSSHHATDLVRQLLAFSRQQAIIAKVLSLNTIISNLDKTLRRLIGEDIYLKIHLAPDLWPVKVDPTQIEQVIFNLAVNALDAMPEGGQLTIETSNVLLDENYRANHFDAKAGPYVLLTMSDTGVGMSEEVQSHIFEPFFTTKEPGKGTGLGLATVFGIVQQSNGYIEVYSELGYGTTFKVYLPRIKEMGLEPEGQRRRVDALPRGTETILLAEDEPKVRDLADRLLRRQGYTVLVAANGAEALRLSHEYAGEIHLLLSDMIMPDMNGKVLADQFKLHRPGVKVLFASGYTDKAVVQQGLLDNNLAFLQKPFSVVELAEKVRLVLDS